MKILFISPLLPYPLIDGGRKGIYYPIKYLSGKGHQIHLACLSETIDDVAIHEMNKYCTPHVVKNSKKRTIYGLLKSFFNIEPYLLTRFHNENLFFKILKLLKENFDIVVVEGLHMAYYGLKIKQQIDIPTVIRLHNSESLIIKRYIEAQTNPIIKAYATSEYKKLVKYEINNCHKFDKVILVSSEDEKVMKDINPKIDSTVIPAGVDTNVFINDGAEVEPNSILWVGALNWPPNQDSFWWFFKKIMPSLVKQKPDTIIYVIGSNAPNEILNVKHPNVKILGYVDSVQPYFKKCTVCVVPLRVGGGIRLKILEMFAMKKAVVSTSIGCEGLGVRHNEELLIADDIDSFTNCIIKLLSDAELNRRLGDTAYNFIIENYRWEQIASKFESVYESVIKDYENK